jgi:hypothetical protein
MPFDKEPEGEPGAEPPPCPKCGSKSFILGVHVIRIEDCGKYCVQILACKDCKHSTATTQHIPENTDAYIEHEGQLIPLPTKEDPED